MLTDFLDAEDTDSGGLMRTHMIKLEHAVASEVATTVKDVFKTYMAQSSTTGSRADSRASGSVAAEEARRRMSIQLRAAARRAHGRVDDRSNTLVVNCTKTVLDQIQVLCSQLDKAERTPANRATGSREEYRSGTDSAGSRRDSRPGVNRSTHFDSDWKHRRWRFGGFGAAIRRGRRASAAEPRRGRLRGGTLRRLWRRAGAWGGGGRRGGGQAPAPENEGARGPSFFEQRDMDVPSELLLRVLAPVTSNSSVSRNSHPFRV